MTYVGRAEEVAWRGLAFRSEFAVEFRVYKSCCELRLLFQDVHKREWSVRRELARPVLRRPGTAGTSQRRRHAQRLAPQLPLIPARLHAHAAWACHVAGTYMQLLVIVTCVIAGHGQEWVAVT